MDEIFLSIDQGDSKEIEKLIDNDPTLLSQYLATDIEGLTPLHYACKINSIQIVRMLIERGADPNILWGRTSRKLLAAKEAVGNIQKYSIKNYKSFSNPPRIVQLSMGAVLAMLGIKSRYNSDDEIHYWEETKNILNEPKSIRKLVNLEVTPALTERMQAFFAQHPDADPVRGHESDIVAGVFLDLAVAVKDAHIGCTPLHFAKSSEVAQLLIDAGATVDQLDLDACTPLVAVCRANLPLVATTLLTAGANPNTCLTKEGQSVLTVKIFETVQSIATGELKALNKLKRPFPGLIPVMTGVFLICKCAPKLFRKDVTLEYIQNEIGKDGQKLLDKIRSLKLELVSKSTAATLADYLEENEEFATASFRPGSVTERLQVLLRLCLKFKAVASTMATRVIHAANTPEMIRVLCEGKADLNALSYEGKSRLHIACERKKQEIVEALLRCAVNLDVKDAVTGKTALHIAVECKESVGTNIAKMLVAHGARIDLKDSRGQTAMDLVTEPELRLSLKSFAFETAMPLHHLVLIDAPPEAIVKLIAENPAAVKSRTADNKLPLHLAVEKRRSDVVLSALLSADPSSARECVAMPSGRLPYFLALERGGLSMAALGVLLLHTLPVDLATGSEEGWLPVERHGFAWTSSLTDDYLEAVEYVLDRCPSQVQLLSDCLDSHGRRAVDVATRACRQAILSRLYFFGRYEFESTVPSHQSATCIVHLAIDHQDPDSTSSSKSPQQGIAPSSNKKPSVALKLMRNKDQFLRELSVRSDSELPYDSVITCLRSHDGDEDLAYRQEAERKGFGEYPYCLVMPAAERTLQSVLAHEHIAGKDWEQIASLAKSILKAMQAMHNCGIMHGDLKPLNLMRHEGRMKIIDLDASANFLKGEFAGAKYSSGYLPPEMIHVSGGDTSTSLEDEEGGGEGEEGEEHVTANLLHRNGGRSFRFNNFRDSRKACVKSFEVDPTTGAIIKKGVYDLVPASIYLDMWSFGALFYKICTDEQLFHCNGEANIDGDTLLSLADWSDELKTKRLNKVSHPVARNLLWQLLSRDPTRRPAVDRSLAHPFLSGKSAVRLAGEEAQFDVFISYRVDADADVAEELYSLLTAAGLAVYLDKYCLRAGVPWERGFCEGLAKSRAFVPLLSRVALNSEHHSIAKLQADSPCDNVMLEHRLALELRDLGLIDCIYPVMIGDLLQESTDCCYTHYFKSHCQPDFTANIVVESVEAKLVSHLDHLALGSPLKPRAAVSEIFQAIVENQGGFLAGPRSVAVAKVARTITAMVHRYKREEANAIPISPRLATAVHYKPPVSGSRTSSSEPLSVLTGGDIGSGLGSGQAASGGKPAAASGGGSMAALTLRLREKEDIIEQLRREVNSLKERINKQG